MDRELTKKEKLKDKIKDLYKILIAIPVIGGLVTGIIILSENNVSEEHLQIAKAERATIESSVTATGKVVPLYEQSIVSPVTTRILEVYCEEGDSVSTGQSLLRLDLESTEFELRRLSDEVKLKNIDLEQTELNNETYMTDLEMKIKTKEMSVNHLEAEVANEKRLDSLGSGTGDKIREAELAYSTAMLELEQMRIQLENERKKHRAAYKSKQLEETITRRNLQEKEKTLEDAKIKAPKPGIITFLNKELGTSISAGEKLAVVSDLSHFKITAEIPESKAGLISVGSIVKARFNNNIITGKITSISPQSQNGMIEFSVLLDDDKNKKLRSGLKTNLDVIFDVHENVVRIPNAQFFQGPGNYNLFIKVAPDKLERRYVTLGDSNFDFIEVVKGIEPGEEVVITDLSDYADKKALTLKRK